MRWQCPKCKLVYETRGEPTQNPGGLGAKAGWTCTFCVTEPSQEQRVAFAEKHGSPFAACWHPTYLVSYEGDKPTDFTISQAKPGTAYCESCDAVLPTSYGKCGRCGKPAIGALSHA